MPIHTIRPRRPEAGRVRFGKKVATQSGKERPSSLTTFRFTSADVGTLEKIAALYGGKVGPWQTEYEVCSEATELPIALVPQEEDAALSQWFEEWQRSGITRRCDGITEMLSGTPCLCAAQQSQVCKPTTRLTFWLKDVLTPGVWMLSTRSEVAAETFAGVHEAFLTDTSQNLSLRLTEKRTTKQGKASRYVLPELVLSTDVPVPVTEAEVEAIQVAFESRGMAEHLPKAVLFATEGRTENVAELHQSEKPVLSEALRGLLKQ